MQLRESFDIDLYSGNLTKIWGQATGNISYAGQIFVTSTGIDEIPYKGDKKIFKITKGFAEVIS